MTLTGIAFALAFLTALVLAITKHPRYGLFAYLAAFYGHPPSRWWGASLPDLRWSLLAAVVTLIALQKLPPTPGRRSWAATTPGRLLIAFTVWIWIQNAWALDAQAHLSLSILFSKYLLLYFLLYRICSTPKEIDAFLLGHVLGCFYLGYLAFIQPLSGRLEGVGGPGIDEANVLAMQLGTAIMCGAAYVLIDRRWKILLSVASLALITNAFVLSGSRGGFLAAVCGGLAFFIMRPKQYSKQFYLLSAVAISLFLVIAQDAFWDRIKTIGAAAERSEEIDNSALSRFALAEAQIRMAGRFPLGTGHRGTEVLSKEYLEPRFLTVMPDGSPGARSSHNTFLSALVEQGFFGAAIYMATNMWCFLTAIQLRRSSKTMSAVEIGNVAAVSAALVVIFIAGVFVDYIKAEVLIWFLALLAAQKEYHLQPPALVEKR